MSLNLKIKKPRHREYKGTPPKNGQTATSRVLSVAVKGESVYVELKSGPGKLTPHRGDHAERPGKSGSQRHVQAVRSAADGNGRPVTRKSSGQANGKAASPTNGSTMVKQPLQHGNGTLVDGKNLTEVQTYRQYLAEKQSAPASKTALLDFYQQRTQVVAG